AAPRPVPPAAPTPLPPGPPAPAPPRRRSGREIASAPGENITLHRRKRLPFHSNAMGFAAIDDRGHEIAARTYYSVGGGFVLGEDETGAPQIVPDSTPVPYPFLSGAELLAQARRSGLPISGVMMANEEVRRPAAEV